MADGGGLSRMVSEIGVVSWDDAFDGGWAEGGGRVLAISEITNFTY